MPKVLLIGWDAADWKVIHPLMDQGLMPGLQLLVENGASGDLATLQPVLSPMLWTTIATGKRAWKHGVHGFTEPDPAGGGIRPITNLSRKTKAVWNILNQEGYRSNVIGWWPSHPAEPIDGVMVSDQFHKPPRKAEAPWPLAPGTVHPERLSGKLAELRLRTEELIGDQIAEFVPRLEEIDPAKDQRVIGLGRTLAECVNIQTAATYLVDKEPWDFMAVYFDAIDHFSHGFMKYHPPRQEWIPETDYELYKDVVNTAYRFHDLMLQALLNKIDLRETVVVLVSDHGFHPDHLRPSALPKEPAGPAAEHRDHGVFVISGPGIRKDHLVHGASLLDITPTLLSLYGLPIGEDMDGAPLTEVFEQAPAVRTVPSWDSVPGEAGTHPPEKNLAPEESRAAVEQLVALGYIDKPSENQEQAVKETLRELDYNLARAYVDAGRYGDAVSLFERLWKEWPREHRFGVRLAFCYQMLQRTADQRRVVEALLQRRRKESDHARAKLKEFHQVLARRRAERAEVAVQESQAADGDTEQGIAQAAREEIDGVLKEQALERSGADKADTPPLMSAEERSRYQELRSLARFSPYFLHYMMGSMSFAEGHYDQALEHLSKAEQADPRSVSLHNLVGQVYLKMQRHGDAERSFRRVLGLDPNNAEAYLGLARRALASGRDTKAANHALTAIGLRYELPLAHYILGVALERLDRFDQAAQALEMAVQQNPNLLEAHRRLEYLYANQLDDPDKMAEHSRAIGAIGERVRRQQAMPKPDIEQVDMQVADMPPEPPPTAPEAVASEQSGAEQQPPCTITIVSGLPRSGTSMMMQMLEAGGLAPLTDDKRSADADNPRGYYEFEPAKQLRNDRRWLPQADGRAVKLVAQLLPYLPPGPHHYRVLFMQRNLDEVLASQAHMLERQNKNGSPLPAEKLKAVFAGQVHQVKEVLDRAKSVEVLYMDYSQVIDDPRAQAERVNAFLGGQLDPAAMAGAVRGELYRQRLAQQA